MIRNSLLAFSAILCAAQPAFAQTDSSASSETETFVIEGTRLNQTETEVGTSVSVITAADMEAAGYDFVIDAIAAVPGVTVNQNGGFGGVATVRIRGAGSAQTLVLIDGVVVNDPTSPGGGFDFSRLDPDSIERIEILRGAQSTLWGTDAIGGVVSIITKEPEHGVGGAAFAEYGSFDTIRGGASVSAANETADIRVAVVTTDSQGISKADENVGNTEEDGFDSVTLSASGGINLGQGARLSGSLRWTDATTAFDSFVFLAPGNVGDGNQHSDTEEFSGQVNLNLPLFQDRFDNTVSLGFSDIARQNYTNGVAGFSSSGDRLALRYQGRFQVNDQNQVAFGAEREETSANGLETYINSLFGLIETQPVNGLTLTGGVRIDDHEVFGAETTARVAAAFNPNENMTWRATWGQGFKAPTIFQTTFFCCGALGPNPNLAPETSESFDVGVDLRSGDGRLAASITLFHQDIDNLIDYQGGRYENIARVETMGVELNGTAVVNEWLALLASYTYLNAEDGNGNDLAQLPMHSADLTVAIDPQGPLSGNIMVRYNGDEINLDGTTLDGWVRVDLAAQYELGNGVEVFGRVENLLDEEYQQILGYGTPDRSGSFGLRFRF